LQERISCLEYEEGLLGSGKRDPAFSHAGRWKFLRRRRLNMPKKGKDCQIGLDQRCRDGDGEIRQKRGDTLVKTLRKTYGPDFAPGVRSDTRLDTLRKRAGGESLSKILKD
jgi:hypothetical protein